MICQQYRRDGWVALKLLYDVSHRFLRAARRPIRYRDVFGDTKTQQGFIRTWQWLVGERKTCDVRRVGVNDGADVGSCTVDARMHADDLVRDRLECAFNYPTAKGNDCKLLRCQVSDVAAGCQQQMLCAR